MTIRIYSRHCARQAGRPDYILFSSNGYQRFKARQNLEPNMQTQMKTTTNEATRMSSRISEIGNINVIKLIPGRHRLLYLLDAISWLLEAVHFRFSVPIRHRCTVSLGFLADKLSTPVLIRVTEPPVPVRKTVSADRYWDVALPGVSKHCR